MRPVPAELTDGPFTTAQARAAGVGWNMLQGRRFVRLLPDVYAIATLPLTDDVRTRAVLLVLPDDAVVSGPTAARLHGFDPAGHRVLHVSTRTEARTRVPGVVLHRHLRPVHHQWHDGVRVTTPERTVVDCARVLALVPLVQLVDHLVHTGRTTLSILSDYCWGHGYHGVRRARRALPLASEDAASPPETTLRLMLAFARLPAAVANADVRDAAGRFVARVDLLVEAWRVVVEYDGRHHETDPRQWQRDRLRREHLESLGYRVVVVAAADLRSPAFVVRRVHQALVQHGYRGPSPVMSAVWHRWFPTR